MLTIVPVVEGDGEVVAVPRLVTRLSQERLGRHDVRVAPPVNAHGSGNLRNRFERYLTIALRDPSGDAVLALLDSDSLGDCPKVIAADLVRRARSVGPHKPIAIVCAHREYEAWFLAGIESLQGIEGIAENAVFTRDVESLRNAKGELARLMPAGRRYRETTHQAIFTSRLSILQVMEVSRSFRRLCHATEELLTAVETKTIAVTPHLM